MAYFQDYFQEQSEQHYYQFDNTTAIYERHGQPDPSKHDPVLRDYYIFNLIKQGDVEAVDAILGLDKPQNEYWKAVWRSSFNDEVKIYLLWIENFDVGKLVQGERYKIKVRIVMLFLVSFLSSFRLLILTSSGLVIQGTTQI